MTTTEWVLMSTLFVIYLVCLFTVCVMTFRKGHTLLGVLGIFMPFLWLVGAVIAPKPGSSYDLQQRGLAA